MVLLNLKEAGAVPVPQGERVFGDDCDYMAFFFSRKTR